jgi:hypothetical protein
MERELKSRPHLDYPHRCTPLPRYPFSRRGFQENSPQRGTGNATGKRRKSSRTGDLAESRMSGNADVARGHGRVGTPRREQDGGEEKMLQGGRHRRGSRWSAGSKGRATATAGGSCRLRGSVLDGGAPPASRAGDLVLDGGASPASAASAPSRRPRPPSRVVASRSLSRPRRVPPAPPLEQESPTRTAESAPRRPGPAEFLQLRQRHRVLRQLCRPPLLRQPAGRRRGCGKLPSGRGAPRGIDAGCRGQP